jgi:DNA-binding transcriptional ArsR family regulator
VPAVDDQLSCIFSALADPTRRQILSRLTRGSATVGTIAEPLEMTGPAVSQHLKVLERAGLVAREPRAQWRIMSIRREPLEEVAEWIDAHRRDWNERLDQLETRIHQRNAEMQAAQRNAEDPSARSR